MRCSQIQHLRVVLGSSASFDLAGLTTGIRAAWKSSSPFSRLSLEWEVVFDVWQCPKSSSILVKSFFQKVTFPVRADVCHQLLIPLINLCACEPVSASFVQVLGLPNHQPRPIDFPTVCTVGPLSAWSSFLSFDQIFSHVFFLTLIPSWLLVLL